MNNIGQAQAQAGISVLKNTMDNQKAVANALMNGFDKVEQSITSASTSASLEPGKGQFIDVHA